MMSFLLSRLFASNLARSGLAAICAAFFLCFSATWAQSIPQGYVATREGDIIVMRPSVPADPDVTIRVYPPIADNDAADAILRRWAESHPLAGVAPSALSVKDETMYGVSSLLRIWKQGALVRQELILMLQAGTGRYRPVVARMPTQPEPIKKHTEALGYVMGLIKQGQFQPDILAEGKSNSAATTAPVEPAGNRTATQSSTPGAGVRAETQAATEQLSRLAAEIETVGFVNRAQMGLGGMWTIIPKPVVLFRSGDVLLDIGKLSRVTSMDADRAAHPKDWSRWKRAAGGIEILQGEKWKKLDYPRTVNRLSAGFALSGQYDYLSGGGDTAIGGGTMIVNNRSYTFRPDGKYSSNRLGFVSTNPYSRSQTPDVEGRYSVDGYLLRLEPPAGPPEIHVFVFDPNDPSAVWIDGHGYTRAH